MNKYKNGKIYKLIDNTNGNIYIGSTININDRIRCHKKDYERYMKDKFVYCKSFDIIKNNDYKFDVICNYSCNSKLELIKKEQEYIDMYDCINDKPAYKSLHDKNILTKKFNDKRDKCSIICECGGKYTYSHKSRHLKTKKHLRFIHLI